MLSTPPTATAIPSAASQPPVSSESAATARKALIDAQTQVNELVLGKESQVRLAFACLLTGGHLLLEDLPGTGKTVLARSLAASLDLSFRRVQFTSDLMPADILGVSVFDPKSSEFELHQGPIFTNVLLADEINRSSPRTQSALLEAMAEGQVSIDRSTLKLPQPFLVVATQNPLDLAGTFPLPSAQKDRFLFQVSLGYPDKASEMALMRGRRRNEILDAHTTQPLLDARQILLLRHQVRNVKVSDSLLEYAYALVEATRSHSQLSVGLSPRASLALVEAAQALAFLSGKEFASPEHLQEAFLPLAGHRVQTHTGQAEVHQEVLHEVLRDTPVSVR